MIELILGHTFAEMAALLAFADIKHKQSSLVHLQF